MKSNSDIAELTIKQTRRFGEWRISPMYKGRMNRTTLGLPTGSGKQGPTVYWRQWGVYYDVDGDLSSHPLKTFSKFKEARDYITNRINTAKI